jgi:hypothetical protein
VGGYNLVALIFAQEVSDDLTSLVKRIDTELANTAPAPEGLKWGVFLVLCNESEGTDKDLAALIEREKLKNVVLTVHKNCAGPRRYRLASQAHETVVVYDEGRGVVANFALRKGELDCLVSDAIMEKVKTVLPRKEAVK